MRKEFAQKRVNKNLGAKAIEAAQRNDIECSEAERAGKVMHISHYALGTKKYIMYGIAGVLVLAGMLAVGIKDTFAKNVLKDPPKYYANRQYDFMVTKIVPSTGYIEAAYSLLPEHSYHNIYHVNMAYGSDPSDYTLSQLSFANNPGDAIILNSYTAGIAVWRDGEEVDISTNFRSRGNTLADNATGRLYYVAMYSDFSRDFARVDYSRCLNSSVFQAGEATECRLEKIGDGKIQYQPYTSDGTRVEIPADEDIELTALTERFVYSSGDWPAEYEWVEDEEPGSSENEGDNKDGDKNDDGADNTNNEEVVGTGEDTAGAGDGATTGASENVESADTETSDSTRGVEISDSAMSADAEVSGNVKNTDVAVNTSLANADAKVNESAAEGVDTGKFTIEIKVSDNMPEENAKEDNAEDKKVEIAEAKSDGDVSAADNVGVPELGKETGKNGWWGTTLLMLLGFLAAIVAWWFLFFGKRKSNKERSREK